VKYAFIKVERLNHRVRTLCRVLGVTEQGYYAWSKRGPSKRKEDDERLSAEIRVLFADKKRRYGSPRLHDDLKARGRKVGKKRVERLMREEGLRAKAARKFRATTDSSHGKPPAPDLVKQNFSVTAPNRVWVGDITYLWTAEGWLYLAVFIDLFSRRVVGWSLGRRLDASLVMTAFTKACVRRRPPEGLIVHTDRGVQYTSEAFVAAVAGVRARQSMSRKGCCWDNAVAESFFHSLKVEAIYGSRFETRREMECEVFDYIERFYNQERRHSAIGRLTPLEFERKKMNRKAAA
jgi:putative transposase